MTDIRTAAACFAAWLMLCPASAAAQAEAPSADEKFRAALAGLSSANVMERRKASSELGDLKDERALSPLSMALDDGNAYVRGNAAASLGLFKSSMAVAPLIEKAAKDASPYVRANAMSSLALIGMKTPEITDVLGDGLNDQDASVKQASAEALGILRVETAVPALTGMMGSADASLRAAIATALSRIGSPASVGAVETVLDETEDPDLQLDIITALGRSKRPSAIPALKRKLRSKNAFIAIEAARSLSKLGDDSGLDTCSRFLSDEDDGVADAAERALQRMKGGAERLKGRGRGGRRGR